MLVELINKEIKILKSFNLFNVGIEGRIEKETLNMLYIRTSENKLKRIEKRIVLFKILEQNLIIDGSRIKNIYERVSLYNL